MGIEGELFPFFGLVPGMTRRFTALGLAFGLPSNSGEGLVPGPIGLRGSSNYDTGHDHNPY